MFHVLSKLLFLTTILLISTQVDSQSRSDMRRSTVAHVPPSPFEVDEQSLTTTLNYLQTILSGKSPSDHLNALFFDEQGWKNYIEYLQQQKCEMKMEAMPVFQQFSKDLKTELLDICGNVEKIDLIFRHQRYGVCPAMKIIGVGVTFHYTNQAPSSLKFQMIDYNHQYKLFNLSE